MVFTIGWAQWFVEIGVPMRPVLPAVRGCVESDARPLLKPRCLTRRVRDGQCLPE